MQNHLDKFDHLIALAAMKSAEDDAKAMYELDISDVSFDPSYYKKRSKAIRKYKNAPRERMTRGKTFRLVLAIVISITMLAAMVGCVPAIREAIYNAIIGWYDEYFSVSYESPAGEEAESPADETLEKEIVAPTYIEQTRKPSNLPEDVWEDTVVNTNAKVTLDYYIGEEYLFSFTQFVLEPADKYVDNEEMKITDMEINGNPATLVEYKNKNATCILWNDKEYAYQIWSNTLSIEALIQYASSVQ
ncbi:MAG: DUF4367 domain-containing protein [Clostridia bacterium]|nr:DUF4367 domain-containing protein [Clostridia bacterium]